MRSIVGANPGDDTQFGTLREYSLTRKPNGTIEKTITFVDDGSEPVLRHEQSLIDAGKAIAWIQMRIDVALWKMALVNAVVWWAALAAWS